MIFGAFALISLFCAAPALADVSDSGNLIIGGQGIIQGTMTVQGADFSVGGTTFSVAGGSVTLGGRLNADAAGIKWADGSVSTTASGSGGGSVFVSSIGLITADATDSTGLFGPCVAGSTLTATFGNYRIEINLHGMVSNFSSTVGPNVAILQDGAFFDGQSSTVGLYNTNNGSGSLIYNAAISWVTTTPVSAGSHSYCVSIRGTGGSTTVLNCGSGFRCQFRIREYR